MKKLTLASTENSSNRFRFYIVLGILTGVIATMSQPSEAIEFSIVNELPFGTGSKITSGTGDSVTVDKLEITGTYSKDRNSWPYFGAKESFSANNTTTFEAGKLIKPNDYLNFRVNIDARDAKGMIHGIVGTLGSQFQWNGKPITITLKENPVKKSMSPSYVIDVTPTE